MIKNIRTNIVILSLLIGLISIIYIFIDKKMNNSSDYSFFDYGKHFIIFTILSFVGTFMYIKPDTVTEVLKSSPAPF